MELHLKKAKAHAVYSLDNDVSSSVKGYYDDYNIAFIKARGSGWFGDNAKVETIDVWVDDDGKIYHVKQIGKYENQSDGALREIIQNIKSKLTKEELAVLGVK